MEEQLDFLLEQAQPGDKLCTTTCSLCNRTFYVFERELYKTEAGTTDLKIVRWPRCPHCGFSGSVQPSLKPSDN